MENLNFTIKNLTLFEDLRFSPEKSSNTSDFELLYEYENKVLKNDTKPNIKLFLTEEKFLGFGFYGNEKNFENEKINCIPKAKYLFLQGVASKDEFEIIEKAAETLFVESLWQEITLKDKTFLRFLKEGEKTVFQIFREIV